MANERLKKLRDLMEINGVAAYYVPSTDYHDSEYVEDFFRCRAFLSGFTGSAGTLVVTKDFSGLWTDGRYFVQAKRELEGQDTELMKMGEEGVPSAEEFLSLNLKAGEVLGMDGRVVNAQTGKQLEAILSESGVSLKTDLDLAGDIWPDRPPLPSPKVWILEERYAGESLLEKVSRVRSAMEQKGAGIHIVSGIDDVAWILNIRKGGNFGDTGEGDANFLPLAHLMITKNQIRLFIDSSAFGEEVFDYMKKNGVSLEDYGDIYRAVGELEGEKILLESGKVNFSLYRSIKETNEIIEAMNPASLMKAAKNPVEMENMRKAHVKDGVALTRFLHWLKCHSEDKITETEAADRLEDFRRQQEGYLGPSFATISAYGSNAAMCHYHAKKGEDAVILPEGLYLVDSGGQYPEGTTDVTRTIAMGPVTEEMRFHCTLVLTAMLRLADAKFLYGCRGWNLDYGARSVLWKYGLDFNHGTGHGVGYLSNVHERPNSFRWKIAGKMEDSAVLEEGMVTSDEPGLYIEGKHGIRTENLLLCRKAARNEFGQFMAFETLTFVPIDLDTIDVSMMEPSDIRLLNQYHRQVFEKLSPYFSGDELVWLKEATREVTGERTGRA